MRLLGAGYLLCVCSFCISPVDIDIPQSKPLLVVEGLITDEPGPYHVRLSRSNSLETAIFAPVSQAEIMIENEAGMQVSLREDSLGLYMTDSAAIRGEVDKKYRLLIRLQEGNFYESDWVLLKKSPPVEQLSFQFVQASSGSGVQVFVTTRDIENKTHFYRWEWSSSWLHIVPFPSFYTFIGNDATEVLVPNTTCWNSNASQRIHIASSLNNAEDIISAYPLHFVPALGGELRSRYSIEVKQFALSELEFLFWKSLKEANEELGTLYDRQPQSTVANIVNIKDESEVVLGYFSVSGVSRKRIFIDRKELPDGVIVGTQYITDCFSQIDTLFKGTATEQDVFERIEKGQIFFDFFRNPDITGWILVPPDCSDCTLQGGTLERPDFWIN